MTNRKDIKFSMLAANPADIYVVTHAMKDGGIEYVGFNDFKIFTSLSMYDNWMEATWFDSRYGAESQIADGARDVYSVEHIRISRENLVRESVAATDKPRAVHGSVVTREPPMAKFDCVCGCLFERDVASCGKSTSTLHGEYRDRQVITFWAKCPACKERCGATRIE